MEQDRRPEPPPGYIPFKWKTRKEKYNSVNLCPACGATGSCWGGSKKPDMGFQDPGVVTFLQQLRKEKGLEGDDYLFFDESKGYYIAIWDVDYQGEPVKTHWSRYGEGYCLQCGVKFWHDFIGYPWHYYYDPTTSKVKKDYQPMLF